MWWSWIHWITSIDSNVTSQSRIPMHDHTPKRYVKERNMSCQWHITFGEFHLSTWMLPSLKFKQSVDHHTQRFQQSVQKKIGDFQQILKKSWLATKQRTNQVMFLSTSPFSPYIFLGRPMIPPAEPGHLNGIYLVNTKPLLGRGKMAGFGREKMGKWRKIHGKS